MRIEALTVRDSPPIDHFSVAGLNDVVVIAGPNGVGKTRLLERLVNHLRNANPDPNVEGRIEATSSDERQAWDKDFLDLASPEDMALFRTTIQQGRRRQKWRSSLVNFESDRTIQNIQPLQFSWDMPDVAEELISWDSTFGGMQNRFQDTVHSMYRMIEAQRQGYGNKAIELGKLGHTSMGLNYADPMQPFKEAFFLLLGPKELIDPSVRNQGLQYRIDGNAYPFQSLSSGEREVVNVAFDFLLREPEHCIVLFDEPELHLHPELSYRLIQTLQHIGALNQFVFSTHSPDVITAALDQSIIFISPSRKDSSGTPVNQAVAVEESDETNQALRLLGQSIGIIALGRRIVLIEGEQSSLDKQTYGSILKRRWPALVLVPSGGKHVLESFSRVYESVLAKSIWGVEFFMLSDRDSRPAASHEATVATDSGRLRTLSRYHLENYFLAEEIWAMAFKALESPGSWLLTPAAIRDKLREIALDSVSYATALTVSFEVRQNFGSVNIMPKDCHGKSLDQLATLMTSRAANEAQRAAESLDVAAVAERISQVFGAFGGKHHK